MATEYLFQIAKYTPLILPMERLTEYLQDLATLFGNSEHVHLLRVDEGSAAPAMIFDDIAAPKIEKRILGARTGSGPAEARRAFQNIDDRLAEDGTNAKLIAPTGTVLIEFPGNNRFGEDVVKGVKEAGTLDGEVIQVGGRDFTINIHLRNAEQQINICTANREQAREIAKYLFEGFIRVYGEGDWIRASNGIWKLEKFIVDSFIPLSNKTALETVAEIRSIVNPQIDAIDDPIAYLQDLRNEVADGKNHR